MVQVFNMKAANQPCVLLLGLPLVSRPVLLRLAWLHFPGFELSSSVIECHQCMVYSWMEGKHTGVYCVLNKYHKSKLPRASRTSNTRQVSVLCTDNWPCLRSNCDLRTRNRLKAKYFIASHLNQIQQADTCTSDNVKRCNNEDPNSRAIWWQKSLEEQGLLSVLQILQIVLLLWGGGGAGYRKQARMPSVPF